MESAAHHAAALGFTPEVTRVWLTQVLSACARLGVGARACIVIQKTAAAQDPSVAPLHVLLEPGCRASSEPDATVVEPVTLGPPPEERQTSPQPLLAVNDWLASIAYDSTVQAAAARYELDDTSRGVVALYAEIDARAAAEQAATAAAQRLARQWQVTFDTLNEALLVSNAEGHVVQANNAAANLFGQGLTGIQIDTFLRERLHIGDPPDLHTPVRALAIPASVRGRRLSMYADPVVENATWRGAVVRLQDITQELAMQEELEERARRLQLADRRKDDYIAMLGHELRNPIATIDGAVKSLRALLPREAESDHILQILERHGSNVQRLVDDLLDVARMKQGKLVLRKSRIDLPQLVRGCVHDMRPRAEASKLELHADIAAEPLEVLGDSTRLEQVMTNLVDNAIKYTPEGGRIDVDVRHAPEREAVVIHVRDSGVGFEGGRIDAAFEAFVQFDRDKDRAAGGMGLGLSVVKALVNLHEGQIRASSPGRGRGSTFELRFPLLDSKVSAPRGAPKRDISMEGIRLLLVEDNADLLALTAMRLRRRGFEVTEAQDTTQALLAAPQHRPQVFVTDIGLPGRDGYELAKCLNALEGVAPDLRVALSGYGPPDNDERRKLFDAYLVKPLDIDKLVQLVQEHLPATSVLPAPPKNHEEMAAIDELPSPVEPTRQGRRRRHRH